MGPRSKSNADWGLLNSCGRAVLAVFLGLCTEIDLLEPVCPLNLPAASTLCPPMCRSNSYSGLAWREPTATRSRGRMAAGSLRLGARCLAVLISEYAAGGADAACNPHNVCCCNGSFEMSLSVVEDVGVGRRPLALRPNPSFSPTFFQPLLCAATARWKPPGEAVKPHSEVGGVVGGVMGSMDGGEFPSLSSVKPSDSRACREVAERSRGTTFLMVLVRSRERRR
jgi:hypothetical protein